MKIRHRYKCCTVQTSSEDLGLSLSGVPGIMQKVQVGPVTEVNPLSAYALSVAAAYLQKDGVMCCVYSVEIDV